MVNRLSMHSAMANIAWPGRMPFIILLAMMACMPARLAVSQNQAEAVFAFSERLFSNVATQRFTASVTNPEIDFSTGGHAQLRSWIGYSNCPTCDREDLYSQSFRFDNLAENEPVEIVLQFGNVAGEGTFQVVIAEGSGEILEGASFGLKPNDNLRNWTIRLRAASSTLRLTVFNQLGPSPSAYAYLDKVQLARGTRLPFSLSYQPKYTGRVIEKAGNLLPLYRVGSSSAGTTAVAFQNQGNTLRAYNQKGFLLWEIPMEEERLFRGNGIAGEHYRDPLIGGFDYNGDGWPDLALVRRTGRTEICGAYHANWSYLELVDGMSGNLEPVTVPAPSKCHHFGETVYPTAQWFAQSIRGNQQGGIISLTQQYSQTGEFIERRDGATVQRHLFIYPSTGAYEFYANARNVPGQQAGKHVQNSQFPNGLMVRVGGEDRFIFFTSRRVVQYRVEGLDQNQLIADHPFLNGGRRDLGGRSYGRVSLDRASEGRVVLIAGADIAELYPLMLGEQVITPFLKYGGIERHLTIYNYIDDRLDHRFFSSVHDTGRSASSFEGRVVSPLNFLLPSMAGEPSRIAFNLYGAGKWALHITEPGSSKDAVVIEDMMLWDIADLDDDGLPELIISPASNCGEGENREGYCLPSWSTIIARWDEAKKALEPLHEIPGKLPALVAAFNEPGSATVYSPHVTALDMEGRLLLRGRDGVVSGVEITQR